MPYGLRFTQHPDDDIRRNWTGMQGVVYDTEDDAIHAYHDVVGDSQTWAYEYHRDGFDTGEYESFWEDPEFMREKRQRHPDPQTGLLPNGKWTVIDHEGLAVWPIFRDPETREHPETDEEALQIAEHMRSKARRDFDDGEAGWSTVGDVRHVGSVAKHGMKRGDRSEDAHVFWSEEILPEESVRK